jgi:hypothetical protein
VTKSLEHAVDQAQNRKALEIVNEFIKTLDPLMPDERLRILRTVWKFYEEAKT